MAEWAFFYLEGMWGRFPSQECSASESERKRYVVSDKGRKVSNFVYNESSDNNSIYTTSKGISFITNRNNSSLYTTSLIDEDRKVSEERPREAVS